jgi:anti-anti-sigma factor
MGSDTSNDDGFSASSRQDGDRVVIALEGELDLHGASRLESEMHKALATPVTGIELDTTDLMFVDSSGLRTILQIKEQTEAAGAVFRIRAVSAPVERVIQVAGLTDVLFPSEPDAT